VGRTGSGCGDERELDEAGLAGSVVDVLGGFAVVAGLGPENVGDERLRIAVVKWEPARLDLHHDPVAGQEDVVRGRQVELVEQRLVGGDGLRRLKALAIAAPENVGGNHQLVAAHGRLARHFVGIDIDQFDDPVRVRAGGGSEEIGDRLSADLHWSSQYG